MTFLKLEDNILSGELPDCWMNWQELEILNLDNNKFTGNLPSSIGSLSSLRSLHLRKNNLFGTLPTSLKNCTSLVALDVVKNWFVGNIPKWIGQGLSNMEILSLRSNKFDGHLPTELCYLTSLHVLDLAFKNLSRTIPSCITNLSAMVSIDYDEAHHIFYEFGPSLQQGVIPNEVTNLKALQSLNLSYNSLSGRIPETISVMTSLESLDFSANQLIDFLTKAVSLAKFTWCVDEIGLCCVKFSPSGRMLELSTTLALLARYFENMKSVMDISGEAKRNLQYMGESYYEDSVTLLVKKNEVKLVKFLAIFSTIDFSNNSFGIPDLVGKIRSL
ncbi:receptor-like protein EIX2 [Pistacia vera]|uniref:receptor-like protein EIX2 n=1 Tax=Pistacia vera TaxID=55513 RepID=UPI0012634F45|nr:receptor-like protein EIX2 [Pistacia vera]